MAIIKNRKIRIAVLMVLVLLFTPMLQVSAEAIPEQTEEILQSETPLVTESPEGAPSPEETASSESMQVPEDAEIPENTQPPEETEVPENTPVPEETEVPENTPSPEQTLPYEDVQIAQETGESEDSQTITVSEETGRSGEIAMDVIPDVKTIAEAAASTGGDPIVTEGTVVFASAIQAVLQDSTGGIRLAFAAPADIHPGDLLQVKGRCSNGGFLVEQFEKTGTGPLPVQENTLAESQESLRILVKGARLGYHSLTQNTYSCQLEAEIPAGISSGDRVDAWGILLDGIFYADTICLSENQSPETPVPEEDPVHAWNHYFGQLHAHTDISDGLGTVEQAFAYAAQVENLDFFAVTDHSNAFDNAELGSIAADGSAISQEWAAGKAAADAVTNETFVGIFGYEMTWQEDRAIGHISTFGTSGWQTRDQAGMQTLKEYLDILTTVPDSLSQFNHPGTVYGDFHSFSDHSPQHDALVHLLEVGGEGSFTAYDAYTEALDAGWHLAPSNNQSNHNGNWGNDSGARTVVLALELTEAAIYDAIRNHRVYATTDSDLKILYHLNHRIMGSTMPEEATLTAQISLEDGSGEPIGLVEVITDGGAVAASATITETSADCSLDIGLSGSYYYLRICREDGIVAVTAPVWVETYEDLGIADLTADAQKPMQGTAAALTLDLYNHENVPFEIETVTLSAGEQIIGQVFAPGTIAPLETLQIPLTYTQQSPGIVTIIVSVQGSVAGSTRNYQKTITLHFQAPEAQLMPIREVRKSALGDVYRICGYVTAGTANPSNTFDGSIYLQDDTGGIEIMDFADQGIQLGTPMEVQGILRSSGGNLVLAMTDYEILEENYRRHVPETMYNEEAMDYETYGGQLLQIEGHVVSLTPTADKLGITRFTIRDTRGDLATVVVEDGIGSGAYGINELATEVKNSRCVRAMGLLHIDEFGTTVLRVRNCDEVVYVPPRRDPSNPHTGDWMARLLAYLR